MERPSTGTARADHGFPDAMSTREANETDAATLGALFDHAVRSAGPRLSTPDQVEAWAGVASDREAYGRRVLQHQVWIAEDGDGPSGFVSLGADGHLGALFVRGDRQGLGTGSALLRVALAAADGAGLDRLYSEVNDLSRPLLEREGFVVTGEETGELGGVQFDRYLVERVLDRRRHADAGT